MQVNWIIEETKFDARNAVKHGVIQIYPNCEFPLNLEVYRRWALIEILRSDAPLMYSIKSDFTSKERMDTYLTK